MIQTGAVTVRPWYFSSTTSPVLSVSLCAVVGLIQTALSQVILFCGLGSSWSQPLLANDPSQTVGSGRNMISIPGAALDSAAGALAVTLTAGSAVFGTTPSCSDFFQNMSKPAALPCACQYSRTKSCAVLSGSPARVAITSRAVLPP